MKKSDLRKAEQKQIAKVNGIVKGYEKAKSMYQGFEDFVNAFLYPTKLSEFEKDFAREINNGFAWDNVNDLVMRMEDRYHDEVSKLNDIRMNLYGFVAY